MTESDRSSNTENQAVRNGEPASPPLPLSSKPPAAVEVGGRGGLDPTRYGDWEKNGRCIDF